jgi:hypothetical protein
VFAVHVKQLGVCLIELLPDDLDHIWFVEDIEALQPWLHALLVAFEQWTLDELKVVSIVEG